MNTCMVSNCFWNYSITEWGLVFTLQFTLPHNKLISEIKRKEIRKVIIKNDISANNLQMANWHLTEKSFQNKSYGTAIIKIYFCSGITDFLRTNSHERNFIQTLLKKLKGNWHKPTFGCGLAFHVVQTQARLEVFFVWCTSIQIKYSKFVNHTSTYPKESWRRLWIKFFLIGLKIWKSWGCLHHVTSIQITPTHTQRVS